jgi:GNAT superfamily N-acetyltransferase
VSPDQQKKRSLSILDEWGVSETPGTVVVVPELRIVPWQPGHRATLDETLEAGDELTRQIRDRHGADVAGPHWRRTIVAETDGRPVAVATVFASRWHPERLWVGVEVAPAHRRRGVGTALLQAAKDASRHAGRPLRGKVFAGSPGALFAEAHGFRVLQRSRTFSLGPPLRVASELGFLVETAATPDAVASAFLEFYARTHTWDPPGEIGAADVRQSHVDDAVATLLVREADASVVAVGCLYDEAEGLVLSGGATHDHPRAGPATGVLLEASAACAEARGQDLLVEVDDAAFEVVSELGGRGGVALSEVHVVALA